MNESDKEKIIQLFTTNVNNQIRVIAEKSGFSLHQVNKVIDNYFRNKKPGGKKTFSESKWNNVVVFCKEINKDIDTKKKYGDADCEYYVEAVLNFSEKNIQQKRTDRGWLATLRQFMNSDKGAGKFRKRQGKHTSNVKRDTHRNF